MTWHPIADMTLSDRIESDLASRLTKRGGTLPCELKLASLAEHYGTSTRPIREALERLKKRGVLTPGAASKIRIVPESQVGVGPGEHRAALEPSKTEVFRSISRQLVQRSLRGDDSFLREVHTAKEFGVSTTVVRELFSKLVGQGIMSHVPRRGWRLRPLTQQDLDDFIDVREVLEIRALQIAWDRLDMNMIKSYLDANSLPPRPGQSMINVNGFHREIIARSGNRYIRDFFERHGPYFDLFFEWEMTDAKAAQEEILQHREILQAILDRDYPRAQAALGHHIRSNNPALNQLLRGRK